MEQHAPEDVPQWLPVAEAVASYRDALLAGGPEV
jgi:hypothetical protein